MKMFEARELREAVAYARRGGQALHLHRFIGNLATAPRCFVYAVQRGERIAHLFDMDEERLIATVRRLGVETVKVERKGTEYQHVDLCGKPMYRAMQWAMEESLPRMATQEGK